MINQIIKVSSKLPQSFAKNYIWVANNLSQDAKQLPIHEIEGIMIIFCEFIEGFVGNDEEALIEITKGLSNLSANDSEESLRLVCGLGLKNNLGGSLIGQMCELIGSKNVIIYMNAVRYIGGILSSDNT